MSQHPSPRGSSSREYEHTHEHKHSAHESHSHSHSIFSAHSHSHGEGGSGIAEALGKSDPGSRIAIVGLLSNVGLTVVKSVAGWYLHSASLLADAGHSASDLASDIVTLSCYKIARKPPSEMYPNGFAKFETLGSTTISLLLIGGALGIGFHSYHLLHEALTVAATSTDTGLIQTSIQNVTAVLPSPPTFGGDDHHHAHGHSHGLGDALDPNAAWFAAISILVKEWLFRATKKVATAEHSSVLMANAYHHRSDAYGSMVALVAILGSWYYPTLPLDPIGGLFVSVVILRQGVGLLRGAFGELTDAGIPTRPYQKLLSPLTDGQLLAFSDVRARRAGSMVFIDLAAEVPSSLSVAQSSSLEAKIERTLKTARKEITEVKVRFVPSEQI